jgi:hypothetical protein
MNIPFDKGDIPEWILSEPVDVTLVHSHEEDGEDECVYLIARTLHPGAVTLTFDGAFIYLNGLFMDLGEDTMAYCGLVDQAADNPDMTATRGKTVRVDPQEENGDV